MDIESTVNAEPVGIVDQQTEETNDTSVTETSENNLEVAEPKQEQTREENAAFAEMRRKAEAAEAKAMQYEKDLSYAKKYAKELGITTEQELKEQYGHQGINTWEDVDNYYEAQRQNVDPELYKRIIESEKTTKELSEKLSKYERKETFEKQEQEIMQDKRFSNFFKANKDEIYQTAEKYNVDLNTARILVLDQKYAEPDVETIKQQAVKEYIEKVKAGNVPVESSSNGGVVVNSSPKSFEEARKNVFAMLRAGK